MNILQTLMKCVYTAGSIRTESIESVNLDRPEIRFKACNVNEDGEEISRGEIQLTNSDLTFYRPGMFPIRWPISCIRRYGCDDDQFSFESGRKGPFGTGIYAFKVDRGLDLINMLRENILKAGLNDQDYFQELPITRNQHNVRQRSTDTAPNNNSTQQINQSTQDNFTAMRNKDAQCGPDEFHQTTDATTITTNNNRAKLTFQHNNFTTTTTTTTTTNNNQSFNNNQMVKSDTNGTIDKSPSCNNTKDASTSTDAAIISQTNELSILDSDKHNIPHQQRTLSTQLKQEDTPLSYTVIDFESTKALEVSAATHAAQRQ